MKLFTSYKVKIKGYHHIFKETVALYRSAVDFFIDVCLKEWENITGFEKSLARMNYVECISHSTKEHPEVRYDFDRRFYKFPSYLRRGAIMEAIGKVSSYKSNLGNWMEHKSGKEPSVPKAGCVYPCLYRDNMYEQTDAYKARIKIHIRNTWDWIDIDLKRSDADYIERHCSTRKKCAPTLQRKGKQWYLVFPFEEKTVLNSTDIRKQRVLSADLGINNACTLSVMCADGTILCRKFLKLSEESDRLAHSLNRIKKAQQHGNYKTPGLWARSKGINKDIAVKTAAFIMETAVLYDVDVIVFEHLERNGRKRGSKKQCLHMWKCREVQSIVTGRAHRLGMRISHVNAWGTSRLAYDGSGYVERGINGNYSICRFSNGKIYNCDLSASYNIGARYFIREIIKSVPAKVRLCIEAKVPQCNRRSTCTYSTLISLNAVLPA